MNLPSSKELLSVCTEAAKKAGMHALENRHRRGEILERFDHDIKLVLDRECQTLAEQTIHNHFPEHAILGEEGSIQSADADYEWIIDPIDGTVNYSHGLPAWCCSIAVRKNQQVLAGAVYVPVIDECFTATIDGPALCNKTPIQTSTVSVLKRAVFLTGLTKRVDPRALAFFNDMAPRVNKIRIAGSAAIDICHVACGRSDGYYESGIYLWDAAAAGLIAERAGAKTALWPRETPSGIRYLCSAPAIHEDIKQIAKTHFA